MPPNSTHCKNSYIAKKSINVSLEVTKIWHISPTIIHVSSSSGDPRMTSMNIQSGYLCFDKHIICWPQMAHSSSAHTSDGFPTNPLYWTPISFISFIRTNYRVYCNNWPNLKRKAPYLQVNLFVHNLAIFLKHACILINFCRSRISKNNQYAT